MRPLIDGTRIRCDTCQHAPRHSVGTESSQIVGDRFRITDRAKEGLNARALEAREEISQIQTQHDSPGCVRTGKGSNRAASRKTVRRWMRGNTVQNLAQDLALDTLQSPLGAFDQTYTAIRLR